MRTVPIHWLLLVCFLATPLSHGQATEAMPMTPHEIAFAFANWSGTPQLTRRDRQPKQTHPSSPRPQRPAALINPAPPEATTLPPRPSETSTAQPAGP